MNVHLFQQPLTPNELQYNVVNSLDYGLEQCLSKMSMFISDSLEVGRCYLKNDQLEIREQELKGNPN